MVTRTADLPVGFRLEGEDDDQAGGALPEGFRLDLAPDDLPSGFDLEEPRAPSPKLIPLTGGQTFLGRQLYTTDAGELIGDRVIAIKSPALNQGRATLIPTVFGGEIVPDEVAIERVLGAGGVDPETGRALPGFDTDEEALSALEQMNRVSAPAPRSVEIPGSIGGETGAHPAVTVPAGPVQGIRPPTPAPPAPAEDPEERTLADFRADIAEAISGLPGALKSAAAALWEGDNPEEIAKAKDWADKVIEERRARSAENFAMPGADTPYVDVGPIRITRADLRNLPDNVAFSLVSMLSGLTAGGAVALAGGPLGLEAGAVASGLAAYRIDTNQALRQLRDGLDRAALHDLGRPLTDDEWLSIAESEDMQAAAYRLGVLWGRSANPMEEVRKHGLHEAGWEAIGNAVLFSAGKAMFKFAKNKSLLKSAGAWTGASTVEVLSEAQTHIGQEGVEIRLGLQDGEEPRFLSAADQAAAIREVAGPTLLLTGTMGAGVAGAGVATGVIQDAHRARVLRREIEGTDLGDPEAIAVARFNPAPPPPPAAPDPSRPTYTADEITAAAERRLAEIESKAQGERGGGDHPVPVIGWTEDGRPIHGKRRQPEFLTDAEKREREFLQRNLANPQALAEGYGLNLGAAAMPAQTETDELGVQASAWGDELPDGFHLVDSYQGHPVSAGVSAEAAAPPPPPDAPQVPGAPAEASNAVLLANQQTIRELERLAEQTEDAALRQRLLRDAAVLRAQTEGGNVKLTPWERSRRARMVNPDDDLITAIRKLGGIDTNLETDWQGRLGHLDAENRAFGLPGIERPGKGLSLDELTELLMDYGYVDSKDAHLLEDLLFQAETGAKVYSRAVEIEQRERELAAAMASIESEGEPLESEWDEILTAAWEDFRVGRADTNDAGAYSGAFDSLREEAEAIDAEATEGILERAALGGWAEQETARQLLSVIRGAYGRQDSAAAPGRTASPQGARGEGQVQPAGPGADNRVAAQGGQAAPSEEGQALPTLTDRRRDLAQRKRVADMTPAEKDRELLTSRRAGIWNDRAYEEHERLAVQVSVDLDGLKWINDNLGHEAGDQLLRAMGDAVRAVTDRGYHISGDEFVLQASTEEEARTLVERITETAERATITVELPDGSRITKQGVGFSYGIGQDLATAETGLQQHKAERERAGLRSARGGEPAGVVRTPAEGQQDREGGPSEVSPAQEEVAPRLGGEVREEGAEYSGARATMPAMVRETGPGDNLTEQSPREPEREIDDATGLPLNDDGTVTLYHHTSQSAADEIRRTGILRSRGEPHVYLTTQAETDTGYGDTAVPVRVNPASIEIDDEFPGGRQDFRLSVGRPGGSVQVTVESPESSRRDRSAGSVREDGETYSADPDREFRETERAYGGREAYDRARAAGRTKLNYLQWVQVRTPSFKRFFGDWEALRGRTELLGMGAIEVPGLGSGLSGAALRDRANEAYRRAARAGGVNMRDGRSVNLTTVGLKKTRSHSADRRVLDLLPSIREVLGGAVPLASKPHVLSDPGDSIRAWHYYGAKVRLGGRELYARLVVRESINGEIYYDNDLSGVEEVGGRGGDATPAKPEAAPVSADTYSLRDLVGSVNPDTVSKVTDPQTGEPLVLYHGQPRPESDAIAAFDDRRQVGDGIYFSSDRDYAANYAVEFRSERPAPEFDGGDITGVAYPVYLLFQNPLVLDGERAADVERYTQRGLDTRNLEAEGYDGVMLRYADGEFEAMAFRPEQIKSATGNRGTFERDDANILREEGVPYDPTLYSGYERAPDAVQGEERPARSVSEPSPTDGPGTQAELLFDLPVEPAAAADQIRDNFFLRYRQVETGEVRVGTETANTAEEAAHILAPFRKYGQETMLALVVDAEGKPLSIVRHAIGTIDGASVAPSVLAGSIASTPGAASYWLAHNHPSGDTRPSAADMRVTVAIRDALDGADIPMRGHLVLGRGGRATLLDSGGEVADDIRPAPRVRRRTVAVTERIIRKQPPFSRPALRRPEETFTVVADLGLRNGLLLLDTRHRVSGVLTFGPGEMGALREGGRVRRILNALGETNTTAVIIVSESRDHARNMARYFNSTMHSAPRLLDAIIRTDDRIESDAQAGGDAIDSQGPWFQRRAPGFYSELQRRIEASSTSAAPAGAWKDFIRGQISKGIKAEEVEWSGVNEWLDLQQGKVTKEQVLDYLRENGVQVEETMLGAADIEADAETQFSAYTLPGGTGYRELLLTLPKAPGQREFDESRVRIERNRVSTTQGTTTIFYDGERLQTYGDNPTMQADGSYQQRPDAYWMGVARRVFREGDSRNRVESRSGEFRSAHFEGHANVLAHVRFNTRTDSDGGRVLFIEEIQSDWAQAGRRKGFAEKTRALKDIDEDISRVQRQRSAMIDEAAALPDSEMDEFNRIMAQSRRMEGQIAELGRERDRAMENPGVPDAPFVRKTDAWVALTLKRMIRYAAENGFDRVAWTTGEQQAERYDLSKQLSRIVYQDNSTGGIGRASMEGDPGRGMLMAYDHSGKEVISAYLADPQKELADHIGKEAADKLIKAPPEAADMAGIGVRRREISGLDLRVGGEGMTSFYDRIVPKVAGKILKGLGGGTVEQVWLGRDRHTRGISNDSAQHAAAMGAAPVHGFDITPELAAQAMGGLPLFQRAGASREVIDTATRRMGRFIDEFESGRLRDEDTQLLGPTPVVMQALGAQPLQIEITGRVVNKALQNKHRHTITPEMLQQIPEALYDPLAVFDSPAPETGQPGKMVLTEIMTRIGDPVIIAIHLSKVSGAGRMRVNRIASTYGLENAERRLEGKRLEYYRNEESLARLRSPAFATLAGMVQTAQGSSAKVLTEADIVKRFGPVFRRTAAPAEVSAEAVESVEAAVRAQLQGIPGIAWEVVPTEAGLPAGLQRAIEREGATGQVSAAYHEGTIYYVAAKLDSPLAVEVATLHELDGHIGFEQLFGDEARLAGNDLFMRMGGFDGIRKIAARHGIDFAHYIDTAKKMEGVARRNHYIVNELLAHLQENRAIESLPERIKRAIQAYWGVVRQWLRRHNFSIVGTEFTDSDLAHLLRSMSRAARGRGATSVHLAPEGTWFQRKVTSVQWSLPSTASIQPMDILRPPGQEPADRQVAGTDLAPFLDRLRGEEDAKELFARTVHQFEGRFEDARRGKISWEETEAMARSLGWTADQLMRRRRGQSFNAEEWEAARAIVDGAMSEVLEAARAAEGGNDADVILFQQRLSKFVPLAEQVLGARAEWGRVGAIMRKQASQAKQLGDILDSMGGRMTIEAKAKALNDLAGSGASPETLRRTVRQVAEIRFIDKVVEAWINGLLSGPQTHAVNVASNQLIALLSVPEHAIAAAIGKLHGGTDKVYMREVMPRAWGLLAGTREGALLGATVFSSAAKRLHLARSQAAREGLTGAAAKRRTREIVDKVRALSGDRPANASAEQDMLWDIREQAGKLEEGTDFFEKVDTGYRKAIGGLPGRVVRLPGNFLQSQDEFYKAIAFRMDLNSRALRQGIREGLSGAALRDRADEIAHKVAALRGLDRPADLTPEEAMLWDMHDALIHFSRYQTFTNPLGPLGRSIQSIAARWPFPFRFIMPFIRTPVNIVKFAGHRSPVAPLMPSFREEWRKGGAARDSAIARMVFGTGLGMTVMMMAMQGAITGGGPSDPDERRLWLQKYRPYSIKVGDTWYSYGRLEPLGMVMGVAADLATVAHIMPESELEEVLGLLYSSVAKNLASKTFLRGISEAVAAYYDPERYGDAWLRQFAGTAIPTGVAQVARVDDPVLRRADTIIEKWKSRIPGLSDKLLPRRDIFGEPIVLGGGLGPDIISPVYLGVDPHDPVVDEMVRLGVAVSPPTQRIGGVKLTPEQYDEYAQMVGQTAKRVLDQMVAQPSYEGLPDALRLDMIDGVFKAAREQARVMMMARYPEIIQQRVKQQIEGMQELTE